MGIKAVVKGVLCPQTNAAGGGILNPEDKE